MNGKTMAFCGQVIDLVAKSPSLPDIRYFIVHGCNDKSVNKAAHADILMRRMGRPRFHG
jgi:hypothetical protein